jgi:hypothetical protein
MDAGRMPCGKSNIVRSFVTGVCPRERIAMLPIILHHPGVLNEFAPRTCLNWFGPKPAC